MTEETAVQKVKFYQTGTYTVGNRLMDESGRTVQASTERSNAITSRQPVALTATSFPPAARIAASRA